MASSDDVLRMVQGEHTDAIRSIEDHALDAAGVPHREGLVDAAVREAAAGWVRAFGSASALAVAGDALDRLLAVVREAVAAVFRGLAAAARTAVSAVSAQAVLAGVRQTAGVVLALSGRAPNVRRLHVADDTLGAARGVLVDGLADAEQAATAAASRRLVEGRGLAVLLAPLGRARAALTDVRAAVAGAGTRAVDAAARAVGARARADSEVWVAERDGCVRCAAYAGRVVKRGADWPGGLSWDPQQRRPHADGIRPPAHPHCRCRPVPWRASWAAGGETAFPAVVAREARRSIARGWSLGSESRASRLRAARALLAEPNPGLPASVLAVARRAVKTGAWPKGRSVPTTEGT